MSGHYFSRIWRFNQNYDLAYLTKKIKLYKCSNIDTLIVGLSYSLFGIKEELVNSSLNMSQPSQDIYYSYLLVKKMLTYKKMNKVIIGMSYYSLYFDLSKAKNEKYRIENVYFPILRESHNYEKEKAIIKTIKRFSKRVLYNNMYAEIISLFACKNYFNDRKTREQIVGMCEFNKLNENKKLENGKKRATMHNKLLSYSDTKFENEKIFKMFIDMLVENNIEPIILICPCTRYYKQEFNSVFKENFYLYINEINKNNNIKIVDLFDSSEFSDDEFSDADHLNENGAIKVSKILTMMK